MWAKRTEIDKLLFTLRLVAKEQHTLEERKRQKERERSFIYTKFLTEYKSEKSEKSEKTLLQIRK